MTLIVHEDPAIRARLRRKLRHQGLETDDAPNGFEALRKVWQGNYVRVLADPGLRGMDGPTLASHLGEIAPEVEIVFFSDNRGSGAGPAV